MTEYAGDASQRLTAVRESINKVLFSQEYSDRSFQQKRALLRDLRAIEKDLEQEAATASSSGGSMATLGRIVRPS